MVIKKEVYNELRRVFPKQVIEYKDAPKGNDVEVKIQFRYRKGKKIDNIHIKVVEGGKSTDKDLFTLLKKLKEGYIVETSVLFYHIYTLDKKNTKSVKIRRDNLNKLTRQIIYYLNETRVSMERTVEEIGKVPPAILQTYYEETNPYADPDKARDGGGYHQPHIKGKVHGRVFEIQDTQCGDFGKRGELQLAGLSAGYDYVSGSNYQHSNIPFELKESLDALNKKYKTEFETRYQAEQSQR